MKEVRFSFTSPLHKRLVKIVDWYDDTHVARVSDHYNKYGFLYARTIFNKKGQLVSRSYYNVQEMKKWLKTLSHMTLF